MGLIDNSPLISLLIRLKPINVYLIKKSKIWKSMWLCGSRGWRVPYLLLSLQWSEISLCDPTCHPPPQHIASDQNPLPFSARAFDGYINGVLLPFPCYSGSFLIIRIETIWSFCFSDRVFESSFFFFFGGSLVLAEVPWWRCRVGCLWSQRRQIIKWSEKRRLDWELRVKRRVFQQTEFQIWKRGSFWIFFLLGLFLYLLATCLSLTLPSLFLLGLFTFPLFLYLIPILFSTPVNEINWFWFLSFGTLIASGLVFVLCFVLVKFRVSSEQLPEWDSWILLSSFEHWLH